MNSNLRRKIIIMSQVTLVIYLQFFLCSLLFANSTSAQRMKDIYVTVSFSEASIDEVFESLKRETGFNFLYNDSKIRRIEGISFQANNESLEEVLKSLSITSELQFRRVNNTISVKRYEAQESVPRIEETLAIDVSGKVTDENGDGLPGATIQEKGTTNGTITDVDGNFSIQVPEDAVMTVSFVGYVSQDIQVNGRSVIDVQMSVDAEQLDEVVVVGYGAENKSDLTGSVAQVKGADLSTRPINSFEQLLQGSAAGVQVTQSSGAPGAGININIRGVTSISGTSQPLVVVDGIPLEGEDNTTGGDGWITSQPAYNILSTLNPNDIESIDVLKDASATAIYGSRGANGVIIITTKSGKRGSDNINYIYRTDISSLPNTIQVLNTNEYLDYANEAYLNSELEIPYPDEIRAEMSGSNTNWQDLIYQTSISQDHQVTISGKTKKDRYSIMGGYSSQKGIVVETEYKRISSRMNYERDVTDNFSFGYTVNAVLSKNNAAQQSRSNGDLAGSVVTSALFFRPFEEVFSLDGDYSTEVQNNPLLMANLILDDKSYTNLNLSTFLKYKILDGLTFQSKIAANDLKIRVDKYFPRGTHPGDVNGGYAYRNEYHKQFHLIENIFNYNKTINSNHSVNAIAGFTWQEWSQRVVAASATDFPNDNLSYNNFSLANSSPNPVTERTQWALASLLSRVNYIYDDKYLLTFTGRYDGSTRLSENNKWAFFPSLAFGWNLHNERFFSSLSGVSQFKLRASYGVSGNQNISVGATQAKLEVSKSAREAIGNDIHTRFLFNSFSNTDLGWEITKQTDIGLDLAFLNHRLRFTFDYYIKNTHDLLIYLNIPSASGYSNYPTNVGEIENKGTEFSVASDIIDKKVKWDITGNISFNRNKVIELGNTQSIFGPNYLGTSSLSLNQPLHITEPGSPVGAFYGYKVDGIYQNESEIENGPEDTSQPSPGDFKFVDISGPYGVPDGKITADDRTIIGNPYPDFILGISNNISYKGFELLVLVQGSIGQDVINLNNYALTALDASTYSNVLKEAWTGRWTGEGSSNYYPKPKFVGSGPFSRRFSDFLVEDGSFIRLKTVSFAYSLPKKVLDKIGIADIKLNVSATNLITWTNYSGYDPEVNGSNRSGMTPGVDYGTIPQYRTYSLGVNVKF